MVFNYLILVFNVNFPFVYSKFLMNKVFKQNEIYEEIETRRNEENSRLTQFQSTYQYIFYISFFERFFKKDHKNPIICQTLHLPINHKYTSFVPIF